MYTVENFKNKKALKDAVKAGRVVEVFNPGLGGPPPKDGEVTVEGPHSPQPHRWYARVTLAAGRVVKVQ